MKYVICAVIGIALGYILSWLLTDPCPPPGSIGTPPAEWNSSVASISTDVSDSAKYISVSSTGTRYSVQVKNSVGTSVPGTPDHGATIYTLTPPTSGIATYKTKVMCTSAIPGAPELTPSYFTFAYEGNKYEFYIFRDGGGNSLTITVVGDDM